MAWHEFITTIRYRKIPLFHLLYYSHPQTLMPRDPFTFSVLLFEIRYELIQHKASRLGSFTYRMHVKIIDSIWIKNLFLSVICYYFIVWCVNVVYINSVKYWEISGFLPVWIFMHEVGVLFLYRFLRGYCIFFWSWNWLTFNFLILSSVLHKILLTL